MKVLCMPRKLGLTTNLIKYSSFNNVPMLVATNAAKDMLIRQAREMNLADIFPAPIVLHEAKLKRGQLNRTGVPNAEMVCVDDIDEMLNLLLQRHYGVTCEVGTLNNDAYASETWWDAIHNNDRRLKNVSTDEGAIANGE